jgi:hypothetical protein
VSALSYELLIKDLDEASLPLLSKLWRLLVPTEPLRGMVSSQWERVRRTESAQAERDGIGLVCLFAFSLASKETTRRRTSEEWGCSGFTIWYDRPFVLTLPSTRWAVPVQCAATGDAGGAASADQCGRAHARGKRRRSAPVSPFVRTTIVPILHWPRRLLCSTAVSTYPHTFHCRGISRHVRLPIRPSCTCDEIACAQQIVLSRGVHHKCATSAMPWAHPFRYQPLALAGLSITKLLVEALRLPKRGARAVQLLCLSRPIASSLPHTRAQARARVANRVDLGSICFGGNLTGC